jgi:hypothetical protein
MPTTRHLILAVSIRRKRACVQEIALWLNPSAKQRCDRLGAAAGSVALAATGWSCTGAGVELASESRAVRCSTQHRDKYSLGLPGLPRQDLHLNCRCPRLGRCRRARCGGSCQCTQPGTVTATCSRDRDGCCGRCAHAAQAAQAGRSATAAALLCIAVELEVRLHANPSRVR